MPTAAETSLPLPRNRAYIRINTPAPFSRSSERGESKLAAFHVKTAYLTAVLTEPVFVHPPTIV